MSKRIQISDDGTTYYTFPGNKGTFSNEAGSIKDTIFGADFDSNQTGLISWTIEGNGLYKGFAGYVTKIMKSGSPTAVTGEATTLVSGKTYKITDATKNVWDRTVTAVVKDGGTPVAAADIDSIDYLFGRVTLAAGYTPTGSITVDVSYLPLTQVAGANSYTLTQTANAVDSTDYETAQGNGGFRVYEYGLKTVSLSLKGIYKSTNGFADLLASRAELIMEINVDGGELSVARGFFKPMSTSQDGDVGDLEADSVDFSLSVPEGQPLPFEWIIDSSSTLSMSIKKAITNWQNGTLCYMNYLADGESGKQGQGVITDLTLTGGLEAMNEYAIKFQGCDSPDVYP